WSAMSIRSLDKAHALISAHQHSAVQVHQHNGAVIENKEGDILDPEYLEVLRQVHDFIFLTPGVDRAWVKSLWAPGVRWSTVNEEGFQGGPVMPSDYDGSKDSLEKLRVNIANAGLVGSLVSVDNRSSMIIVPIFDKDPYTGVPLDYVSFTKELEKAREIGEKSGKCNVYITGFAKLVGDLIAGLKKILWFFGISILIITAIIFSYTRCYRCTSAVIVCSFVAVVWQIGILSMSGMALDPYSILVPFLVFAIGVSHGSQVMNGILHEVGSGNHPVVAARYTFRKLFLAGLVALITDAVGFAVLMVINIPVIRELALTASIGVAVLIFTNLIMMPVIISYMNVSPKAAKRVVDSETDQTSKMSRFANTLAAVSEKKVALKVVVATVVFGIIGVCIGIHQQVGDLDPGAPELRPNSRYNKDNQFIMDNYSLSSDLFAVIVKTPPMGGMQYETLIEIDRLAWELEQLPEVQRTVSTADAIRQITIGTCEGSPKWYSISRNQKTLNFALTYSLQNSPELSNMDVSVMPLIAYLKDHKATTLDTVIKTVEEYAREHNVEERQFLLAAGTAGVEAATNIVVAKANIIMLVVVYLAVIVMCNFAFRTWRAVVVAIIPLVFTSILCQALMVLLGIGVKVATLSVTSLGVGLGVDYAIYLLSVQLVHQRTGVPLREAYRRAVHSTGKVVALIGVTLSAGVITWAVSPIKFQGDMGVLLTFMLLWNMTGALVLIPALSHYFMQTSKACGEETDTACGQECIGAEAAR
ncbi:MAG: MMPL family transporter, partial [Desulfomonilia bacterium]